MSTDLDRRLELEENGLRNEDLASLGAQVADLRLKQLDLLAGPAAPDLKKTVYDRVEIYLVFRHSCDLLLGWCRGWERSKGEPRAGGSGRRSALTQVCMSLQRFCQHQEAK